MAGSPHKNYMTCFCVFFPCTETIWLRGSLSDWLKAQFLVLGKCLHCCFYGRCSTSSFPAPLLFSARPLGGMFWGRICASSMHWRKAFLADRWTEGLMGSLIALNFPWTGWQGQAGRLWGLQLCVHAQKSCTFFHCCLNPLHDKAKELLQTLLQAK